MASDDQSDQSPPAFAAEFCQQVATGKYTRWATHLTEDQLMAVLWAVGEFAFRSTPILASLRRHRDESPPISGVPRALLALHLLDQMVIRGAISLDDVRKQMRIEDEKCRQGENGQS